jgi:hypothetical protein
MLASMARPLRIEYPGAYYHVMNRGLSRRNIFLEAKDYERFLELLGEASRQRLTACKIRDLRQRRNQSSSVNDWILRFECQGNRRKRVPAYSSVTLR